MNRQHRLGLASEVRLRVVIGASRTNIVKHREANGPFTDSRRH
ncbi:MAG: helix-hairpin-helix domain-containing protein [Bacillus subtilis]|nr:helix-hairpin-helix domain-containing protein [Bacillus subtilis]